jgi:acyl-CoA thioester hydrolase
MARFAYHCALRWSDMDAYGHVNNAKFLTFYEEARAALLFGHVNRAGVATMERGVVIARHEIDYLRAVDYGTLPNRDNSSRQVRIELWIDEIRAASFTMAYELFDNGDLASRARSVVVPYDLIEGRPRRLTDDEQGFLLGWRDGPTDAGDR